jgi:glycosyltransferase involved in cell wall biosynthesis
VVRRIGVLESSSEWVAFLDADDYWDIDKIERQLELATKSGSGLIYSNAWLDKEAQVAPYFSPISRLPSRLTTFKLLTSNYVINSSVLVRREHLLAVGGFADSPQVRAVEDYATWLRLSTVCQMAGIQDPLLTYTESESSFSKVNSGILPVMAIRDFRSWVSRSTMPVPMKAKYIFMSSVMIQYHTSRGFISRSLDGLRTKR